MIGTCRLCLAENVDLRDSHIIPALAYRRIREPSLVNGNPVMMRGGRSLQTSEQVKEYLLCTPCEQRFSVAEGYIAPLIRQHDGSSGLETMLCDFEATPYGWRAANAEGLDRASVLYFAASVFWRAHVSTTADRCELGSRFGEAFRAFLNKETDQLVDVAIMLMLYERAPSKVGRIDRLLTLPTTRRVGRYHLHQFILCGCRFDAAVGQQVPASLRAGCLSHPTENRILLVPQADDMANVLEMLERNPPSKRLSETLLGK